MKRMGLRVTAIVIFLLAFGASNVGSCLLGRAMVENRVIPWEETRTFYAQIVESQDVYKRQGRGLLPLEI